MNSPFGRRNNWRREDVRRSGQSGIAFRTEHLPDWHEAQAIATDVTLLGAEISVPELREIVGLQEVGVEFLRMSESDLADLSGCIPIEEDSLIC